MDKTNKQEINMYIEYLNNVNELMNFVKYYMQNLRIADYFQAHLDI